MNDQFGMYRLEDRREFGARTGMQEWMRRGREGHGGAPSPWNRAERRFAGVCGSDRGFPEAGPRMFGGMGRFPDRGECGPGGQERGFPSRGHGGIADRGERGWERRGGDESRAVGGRDDRGFVRSQQGFGERGFGGRGERGFGGGRHGGPRFGFGGTRERLFEGGDLKLVILKLIADKPSYGYELIKTMEERLAGGYAPSPGVVYPTLTMLEEEGLATVATSEAGKKVYAATDAGRAELVQNERRLAEIFERLEHAGRGFRRGRSPEIMRAFLGLRRAVQARVSREGLTAEQTAKMAEAIDAAARAIDGM